MPVRRFAPTTDSLFGWTQPTLSITAMTILNFYIPYANFPVLSTARLPSKSKGALAVDNGPPIDMQSLPGHIR